MIKSMKENGGNKYNMSHVNNTKLERNGDLPIMNHLLNE